MPEFIQHMGRMYGYIALNDFLNTDENRSTCKQKIKTAILEVERQGAEGIVLDLRNNGGGFLAQASCVAGLFQERICIAASAKPERKLLALDDDGSSAGTKLNLVVLINSRSPERSEVVAGFPGG
ncbi:MAG: hypothetical protein IPK68_22065 [Bdellovibrionales bacterium]|nr:hypothetical protein [Bdellovibrionales bacterium]